MAVREFRLEELINLDDGRVVAAFNAAVKRAVEDCDDRPGETNARKVTLQAEFVPVLEGDGQATDIDVSFQIKDTLPTRKSKTYRAGYRSNSNTKLIFNDLSDDNPNQMTLDEGNDAFEE